MAWIFFRYRSIGSDSIPPTGGILVAANHASYLDIPLLGCGIRRRVAFLGRANLFPNPILNWILRTMGWIPLRTDRLDRQAFREAVMLLKAGRPVVIFPEGKRTLNGQLQPGKPGIGAIVAEAGCRVVPAYVSGTYQVLPTGAAWVRWHPVTVTFGKPIDFSHDSQVHSGKLFYHHVSRTVMGRIAELGHVAPPADPVQSTPAPRSSNVQ